MNRYEVSIVIPAYNSEATLPQCLEALEQQTYPPLEIIVVDDGSTDKTVELAQPKAVVLHNTNNKGAGGARNTGAAAARGDIIAFTDSDCVPPSQWLEKIVRVFDQDNVAAVAGGYSCHIGKSLIGKLAFLELSRRRRRFPDYVQTAVSNNFAVKTQIFNNAGGFPEMFVGATLEDMVLSFKISCLAKIRWLRNNGVGHHFPETYLGYLKQQHSFARDTVVTYKHYPQLFRVRTHQGRLIHAEMLVAALSLCALCKPWPWAAIGFCLLWTINLLLLLDVFSKLGFAALVMTVPFIPIRDLNWVFGVFTGLIKVFRLGPQKIKRSVK